MSWSVSAPVLGVSAGAVLAAMVATIAYRAGHDPLARSLTVLMLAIVAWAVPDAIGMLRADVGWLALWAKLALPGAAVAPVAYLVFALRYAGADDRVDRRVIAGLLVIPAVSVLLVATEPTHGLFWADLSFASQLGAPVLVITYGPWYWIHLGYLYLVTMAALAIFGRAMLRLGPIYRQQSALLFVGGLVPLVTNMATVGGLMPGPGIDLTAAALSVSGLLALLALYQFDLLRISPIARHQLVEHLDDGMIVVGPDGRIRDFNRTAATIFPAIEIDRPLDDALDPAVPTDGGEIVVDIPGGRRVFHARSTPLLDGRERPTGTIYHLSDVTGVVHREQRLSVFNRVLRHNIRNELTVLEGYLADIDGQLDGDVGETLEGARTSAKHIQSVTEKARELERTLHEDDVQHVDPGPVVESVVAETAERYPEARIESILPPELPTILVSDERLLALALSELIENAVEHAVGANPTVAVGAEVDERHCAIVVMDDGPGIPGEEIDVLGARIEPDLDHSSGLGLWIAQWTARHNGGYLRFDANEPTGTAAWLALPRAFKESDRPADTAA